MTNTEAYTGDFQRSVEPLVTDPDREYVERARGTYKSIGDLPGRHVATYHDEYTGSEIRYAVYKPNPAIAPSEHDGVVVMGNPFANSDRGHMRVRSQVIADMTGARVINFPNNLGSRENIRLSKASLRLMKETGFRALALVQGGAVDQAVRRAQLYPLGWSEGGSTAAAFGAANHDYVDIRAVGAYDSPNVMERGPIKLAHAFVNQGGEETFEQAYKRVNMGALDEGFREGSLAEFFANALRGDNAKRLAHYGNDTLGDDLEHYLRAVPEGRVDVVNGSESNMSPETAVKPMVERLQREFGSRAWYLSLEGAGHGAGDNVFVLGVLAKHTTQRVAA